MLCPFMSNPSEEKDCVFSFCTFYDDDLDTYRILQLCINASYLADIADNTKNIADGVEILKSLKK